MSAKERPSEFFVAGGTLKANAPSYVNRPTDDELFELTLAGELCYVLTPRQMGKSSLMVHTARRLQARGVDTAIVDLTQIGTGLDIERWYLGLLSGLGRRLGLAVDPEAWWQARSALGCVQRFIDFMQDVVLVEMPGQVVIFIDEIDTTLNLDFRDDFFAAIRATYNARAADPKFERLTFVLLGVASPPELIKDPARTPFNIGHGIALEEFGPDDATVLRNELEDTHPGQGGAIFDRIFYWTNGHPYLTQKLCLAVAESEDGCWPNARVDALVEKLFLSEEARRETNLQFVQDKILTHPQRDAMLDLYKDVVRGRRVGDDGQSPVQNQLKLSGLVKTEDGTLCVRNEIYRRAFDRPWVRKHTAVNWAPIVAGAAAFVALLSVGLLLYSFGVDIRFDQCATSFHEARNPQERLEYLACQFRMHPLFGPSDYEHRAQERFYGLSREEQLAIFQPGRAEGSDLVLVIQGLYITMADVDGTGSTDPLLQAMASGLGRLAENEKARELTMVLTAWQNARRLAREGSYQAAIDAYAEALAQDPENPAVLFEQARILTQVEQYPSALENLDLVMVLARRGPIPTSTPTPSAAPGTDTGRTPVPGTGMTSSTTLPRNLTLMPSAGLLPSPAPSQTLAAVPTEAIPIVVSFVGYSGISYWVRLLIYASPGLIDELMRAPTSDYPNLREAGLAPMPTATLPPTGSVVSIPACVCGDGACNRTSPCFEGERSCPNDCSMPDLVVASLVATGSGTINAEGQPEIPIRVVVRNQGGTPADTFKVSTSYTGPDGTFPVAFTVPGQASIWYPTYISLDGVSEVTFDGSVTFRPSQQGQTISLKAQADSCVGDEFMPSYCRVEEGNEHNNESESISLSLPAASSEEIPVLPEWSESCSDEAPPYCVVINRSIERPYPDSPGTGCQPIILEHPECEDCKSAECAAIAVDTEVCQYLPTPQAGEIHIVYEMCGESAGSPNGTWLFRVRLLQPDGTCPLDPINSEWFEGLPPGT